MNIGNVIITRVLNTISIAILDKENMFDISHYKMPYAM